MGEVIIFTGSCQLLGVGTVYVTILGSATYFSCGDCLFGVGVANFIFRRRVAFLFRVAAAYVMGGAIFGGLSALGSGAVFGGCNGIVRTLGYDVRSFFLVDCHRVRILLSYLIAVLRLQRRRPSQRLI